MSTFYTDSDQFASYISYFKKSDRMVALLDLLSTIVWFGAKAQFKGFAPKKVEFNLMRDTLYLDNLNQVKSVRISMKWMADGVRWGSKRLFSTLRDELEGLGLLKVDRQAPRKGKGQDITAITDIDFEGLLLLSRAVVVRLQQFDAEQNDTPENYDGYDLPIAKPAIGGWLPSHGFEYFAQLFKRLIGKELFLCESVYRMDEGERDWHQQNVNAIDDLAKMDEIDNKVAYLHRAVGWYVERFGRPIVDDTFLLSPSPTLWEVNRDLRRWEAFYADLQSGACSSWDDFAGRNFGRIAIDQNNHKYALPY